MKLSQILGQTERNFLGLTEVEKRNIAMMGIEELIEVKKELDSEERKKLLGDGIKLNLGCGNRKIEGFVNIDSRKIVNPDVVYDLEEGLPKNFKDNSVSYIYASNILEHIRNLILLMEDIYRVCQNGATVEIYVPYYKSYHAFTDPTHVRFFTEDTFGYFSQEHRKKNNGLFDYDFKCDFDVSYNIQEDGLMRVILKVKKEDSNADSSIRKNTKSKTNRKD